MWLFVAPGLYEKEKRAFLPFLIADALPVPARRRRWLIIVAMPVALHFLLGYRAISAACSRRRCPAIGNYLDFVMRFIFGFGVAFLLPVLLMLLERAGLVTRDAAQARPPLRDRRRLRRRGGADPARRDLAAAARGAAGAALRSLADRDLVHRAEARAARSGEGQRHKKSAARRRRLDLRSNRRELDQQLSSTPSTQSVDRLDVVGGAVDRIAGGKHQPARTARESPEASSSSPSPELDSGRHSAPEFDAGQCAPERDRFRGRDGRARRGRDEAMGRRKS